VATIKVEIARCLIETKKSSTVVNPHQKANNKKDETRYYSAPPQYVAFFLVSFESRVPSRAAEA
jgi:hypothetical protein